MCPGISLLLLQQHFNSDFSCAPAGRCCYREPESSPYSISLPCSSFCSWRSEFGSFPKPAVPSSPSSNSLRKRMHQGECCFPGLIFYLCDFEQHLFSPGEAEWQMAAAEGWDVCFLYHIFQIPAFPFPSLPAVMQHMQLGIGKHIVKLLGNMLIYSLLHVLKVLYRGPTAALRLS